MDFVFVRATRKWFFRSFESRTFFEFYFFPPRMLHSCDSSIARIDFRLGESRKDDKRRRLYLVIRGTRGILRCIAAMIDGQVANQNVKTPRKNDSQWRSQPAERDLSRSWQMRTQIFSIQHKHWYVKSNITLPPFSFSLSLWLDCSSELSMKTACALCTLTHSSMCSYDS